MFKQQKEDSSKRSKQLQICLIKPTVTFNDTFIMQFEHIPKRPNWEC